MTMMKSLKLLSMTIVLSFYVTSIGWAQLAPGPPLPIPGDPPGGGDGATPYNVILINLDDADAEMFEDNADTRFRYPNIMQMADEGVTFTNMHVTTPLCGPSRACLYTGLYAHNTNIRVNDPTRKAANNFTGGYQPYKEQGYLENDIAMWMKDAGYRTMLVGKYLHHQFTYDDIKVHNFPHVENGLPNWDDFISYNGNLYTNTHYMGYERDINGLASPYTGQLVAGEYRTIEEVEDVTALLAKHKLTRAGQPFFLNWNPFAPHSTASGLEMRDTNNYPAPDPYWDIQIQPFSFAYNEADTFDKRGVFRTLDLMDTGDHNYVTDYYRDRLVSVKSVDDLIGDVRDALVTHGYADNTYIMLTSDNGFSLGHNRWIGKGGPTNRASNVPFIVLGPNVPAGQTSNRLLGHIDIAPTIATLANASFPSTSIDGKAFASLVNSPTGAATRSRLVIENWEQLFMRGGVDLHFAGNSLRLSNQVYTEWANGERDWFSMTSDDQQINNWYDNLAPSYQSHLAHLLRLEKDNSPLVFPSAHPTSPYFSNVEVPQGEHLHVGKVLGGPADIATVAGVKLTIWDYQQDRYWDGETWVDPGSGNPPQLRAEVYPQGGSQFWRYEFDPDPNEVPANQHVASFVWKLNDAGGVVGTMENSTDRVLPYLQGYAEHPHGIETVELMIRDYSRGGLNWNGANWVSASARVNAMVYNKNGQITKWRYEFDSSEANLPNGVSSAFVWAKTQWGFQSQVVISNLTAGSSLVAHTAESQNVAYNGGNASTTVSASIIGSAAGVARSWIVADYPVGSNPNIVSPGSLSTQATFDKRGLYKLVFRATRGSDKSNVVHLVYVQ